MEIPDIIGFNLGDALEVLKKGNIPICKIDVTSAPRLKCLQYDDSFKVLRMSSTVDKKVKLLICKPL